MGCQRGPARSRIGHLAGAIVPAGARLRPGVAAPWLHKIRDGDPLCGRPKPRGIQVEKRRTRHPRDRNAFLIRGPLVLLHTIEGPRKGMATKRKSKRGGPRRGSGRPRHPEGDVRRNRVVVMVTDGERAILHRMAETHQLPLATVAHRLMASALRRARWRV